MSRRHGQSVVNWLQRGGKRFLQTAQPHVYQQFLLQTGGTDLFRHYDETDHYWHFVQAVLDCFFTSAQRADLCGELIEEPIFAGRKDFHSFLIQARAEIRAQEMITAVEALTDIKAPLRSVGNII